MWCGVWCMTHTSIWCMTGTDIQQLMTHIQIIHDWVRDSVDDPYTRVHHIGLWCITHWFIPHGIMVTRAGYIAHTATHAATHTATHTYTCRVHSAAIPVLILYIYRDVCIYIHIYGYVEYVTHQHFI